MLADTIRRLTVPGALPALIHCEAGCDRTGVLTAIILDLAGVPDDEICADFAATAAATERINVRIDPQRGGVRRGLAAPGRPRRPELAPDGRDDGDDARADARAVGQRRGLGAAYGLTDADLAALRAALTVLRRGSTSRAVSAATRSASSVGKSQRPICPSRRRRARAWPHLSVPAR